jgi:hypothetical protein
LIRAIALAGLLASAPAAADPPPLGIVHIVGQRTSGPFYAPRTHYFGWRWAQDCHNSNCTEDWAWDWLGDPHPTEPLPEPDAPPPPPDGSCPDLNADWLTAGCTQESLLPRDVGEGHISQWQFYGYGGMVHRWMGQNVLTNVRETVNFSGSALDAGVTATLAGRDICEIAGIHARLDCFEAWPGDILCYQVQTAVDDNCFQSFGQLLNEWMATLPFHVQSTQIVRTCTAINDQRQAGNCQF